MSNYIPDAVKTTVAGAYGFGYALVANAPTLGLAAQGTIGAIPAALTALTHCVCKRLEENGTIAPGRTKLITSIASFAFAAVTFAVVLSLGLTSPLGALFFATPALVVGMMLNHYFAPVEPKDNTREKKIMENENELIKAVDDDTHIRKQQIRELEEVRTSVNNFVAQFPADRPKSPEMKELNEQTRQLDEQINAMATNTAIMEENTLGINEERLAAIEAADESSQAAYVQSLQTRNQIATNVVRTLVKQLQSELDRR